MCFLKGKTQGGKEMKKTILKVLASMLVLAMAITAFVIPSSTAKAADKQTKIVLVFSAPAGLDRVLLDIENQNAGITATGTKETNPIGWGRDMYVFTKESDTRYSITLKGTVGSSLASTDILYKSNAPKPPFKI